MSEKAQTIGGFRVARPASKRIRSSAGNRPVRLSEAKSLINEAVTNEFQLIEKLVLKADPVKPAALRWGIEAGPFGRVSQVVLADQETPGSTPQLRFAVGGKSYRAYVLERFKDRRAVQPTPQASAAPQKKVFKVARIDRAKSQLPVVAVVDAESTGRRATLEHFGLPHEE